MRPVLYHRSAPCVLLLSSLITLSPVSSLEAKCPDDPGRARQKRAKHVGRQLNPEELNPFNLRPYRVPEEASNEPKEQLALFWIARDDVGCGANHNDDLKKKVNFTRSAFPDVASRVFVSEKCQDHVKFWLDRIIKAVQHNLLVTIKVKAIHFFQPNQYQAFKNFQFKRSYITSLPPDQILQIIDKTGHDLKNGLTLPGNEKLPSYDAYNETFSELLKVYGGIYHALFDLRDVVFNRVNGCDNKDTQCLEQMYKTLIGESNDWSGRVLGYVEIRKIVDDGIRAVRAAFREGTSERDHFDGIKLPMTEPCFSA